MIHKSRHWYPFLWILLLGALVMNATVLSITADALDRTVESIKTTFYLAVALVAAFMWIKEHEIKAWLDVHAPF